MQKRWVLSFVVLALLGAACSKSSTTSNASSSASSTPTATGASYSVNVDGKNAEIPESFLAYFPATVTAHPGDSVTFNLVDTGEPHTVALGTLADAAVTAAEKNPNAQGPPAEDAALPQFTPVDKDGNPALPQTALKTIPSAADPCSIATGPVPTSTACPAGSTPSGTFNGTESFYGSGWLASGTPFAVKLSASIKPGSYKYMCLIHREGMTGTIVVTDPSQSVPSPTQQAATGQAELVSATASFQPAVGPLAKGTNPELKFLPSGPKIALAGSGLMEANGGIDQFGPAQITATVGSTISWIVLGPHTISFNAPTDAQGIHMPGTSQINHKAIDPVGGPGQTAYSNYSGQGPPPAPLVIKGGSFDGNGFRSSGVIFSFPPALLEYQLTFTAKGTFPYQCLVHDGMKGVVTIQ